MNAFRIGVRLAVAAALALTAAYGQSETNPLTRDAEAVAAGRALYLERCAVCHGQDATGSMAANLVHSRSVSRGSDGALFRIIQAGFPGTAMPPQTDLAPRKLWQLVTYLHSLARPGLQPPLAGDVDAGRKVFETAGCAGCHQIDGAGGFFGPPLNSIAARKTSEQIRDDVLNPNAELLPGYKSVVAVTRSGKRVEGVLKNEDLFSAQILTRDGEFELVEKSEISELQKTHRSAMPTGYQSRLSGEELRNLLAFLDRQRDPYVRIPRGFANY